MSKIESSDFLHKVYSSQSKKELKEAYDQWAEKYDEDVTAFGYMIPAVAAGLFGKYVTPEASPILDAGAGTGLMGNILDAMGYHDQVGIDISTGMLDMASKRNIYKELHQMVLGEPLNFPPDHFSACQSIGVFTAGHAPASAFDELVRVLSSGAYLVFSLLEDVYYSNGYKDKFEALENAGKWQIIEKTRIFSGLPLEDPELFHRVYVYRIC
jgi:predicted TPR repeat methyltransferase